MNKIEAELTSAEEVQLILSQLEGMKGQDTCPLSHHHHMHPNKRRLMFWRQASLVSPAVLGAVRKPMTSGGP